MFLARKNSQTKEKTEKKREKNEFIYCWSWCPFEIEASLFIYLFIYLFFVSLLGKRSLNTDLNFGANDLCISEKPKKSSGWVHYPKLPSDLYFKFYRQICWVHQSSRAIQYQNGERSLIDALGFPPFNDLLPALTIQFHWSQPPWALRNPTLLGLAENL